MYILGISAYYHDSAAVLVKNGLVIAAAQEERFTRKKNDASFPHRALGYCLSQLEGGVEAIDYIVFYEKPLLKFERLLETYVALAPKGFASFCQSIPTWVKEKIYQKKNLVKELQRCWQGVDATSIENKLLFSEHHLSHAGSAFFPSPFERAAILTMDGVGEWATAGLFLGAANKLSTIKEMHFPHSLGLLYSAFTYYLGFKVNSGEYKMMGLAPYGEQKYKKIILDKLIDVKEDGSFRLNLDYFDFCAGLTMVNEKFTTLFQQPLRQPHGQLSQFHMDIAASIQAVIEEVVLKLTRAIAVETKEENLCLAGGVALNCVANGKILRDKTFKHIWIQPAAGDAGGALGAALCAYYLYAGRQRETAVSSMRHAYLGPAYTQQPIEEKLKTMGAHFRTLTDEALLDATVDALCDGKVVGWFQGNMEFGPRALGNRSILADPRSSDMQKALNLKVKNRESFRPFAPAVMQEKAHEWFNQNTESPYMLLVTEVNDQHRQALSDDDMALTGVAKINAVRSTIPAVTHVNHSARLQTVSKEANSRFYCLIEKFEQRTGCPMLVNTSFNVCDEPIVASPEDAYHCFMSTHIDILVIGNCLLSKAGQETT